MIKRLLKASSWRLMVILLISGLPSHSQMFAMATQTRPSEKSKYEAIRLLNDVLNELKNHYRADILFELKTVQGITISSRLVNTDLSLEQNLENVLRPVGLKYKKINRTSYTVFADKSIKVGALSNERFQENNVESTTPIESTEKSLVANINMSNIGNKTEYSNIEKNVKGKVTDALSGDGLPGVSITIRGTTRGTTTDGAGEYSIKSIDEKTTLVFSFVGYESQEVLVGNKNKVDVALSTDNKAFEEVIVVGYGTQKKTSLTGAVSKYKNERLDEAPVTRLDQALQGKIAGVQIQNISSEAGAAPKITIRGISSVNAGASPLVVVDGQPVPDGLAFVNMADVESVEVLKDAASAAIYGSRGASGVILITTKSGKSDKPTYSFKYSIGQKTPYKRYDIMSATEYVELLFQEAALRATDPSAPARTIANTAGDNDRAAYIIEQTLLGGKGADYQSESLRSGKFQNILLSASGGKKEVRYFISGGYQSDEGMMFKSNYEKLNIRAKVDVDLTKRVKLSLNLNPSYSTRETPSENFTNFMRFPSSLPVYHNEQSAAWVRNVPQWANIQAGDFAHPRHFSNQVYSGLMPDGSTWTSTGPTGPQTGSSQNNPKSSVLNQDINTNEYRLQSSGNLTFNLAKGLDFKTMASIYVNNSAGLNWANRNAQGDGIVSKGVYTNNSLVDLLSENTLNYVKTIGKHSINALVGYTAQTTKVSRSTVTGLDYPSDNIRTINNASQIDKAGTTSSINQIGLLSYLGRVNYEFNEKYLLSASFRADGSSYFGPGNKWGTFPSVSVGWVATEEKFMKNITWLDKLKVRASYGISGNNRILDFGFVDLMYSANYPLGTGNGNLVAGQSTSPTIVANKNITWESTFQTNLGIDLGILKNKIELSVDVYQSKTDKLLLQQSSMAFIGVPLFWNNIGSLQNKGIEVELTTRNISTKDFKWTTSANFSHTKNKILELGNEAYLLNQGERTEVYQNKVGDPLIQFFGYKTDGVWLSQADVDKAKADGVKSSLTNYFVPGGLKLVDINGDKIIDNNDRTVIGNPYPDFTWGITNNFNYKAFDISFSLQGVQGGSLINGDPNYNEAKQKNRVYNTNRWLSPMFPGDGKTPYNTNGFNWLLTDYVVEDASYFTLRDINVGYKLPSKFASLAKLKSLRVYFSGQNLYFHTAKGYRGLNPEGRFTNGAYGSSLVDGYQRGSFPIPKTFIFGIDVNF
jgi:TonB-dependent starch-binding outer membrane protein SusC